MKKRYAKWLVLLVAGAALVAVACTSKDESAKPIASQEQEQPAAMDEQQAQPAETTAQQQEQPADSAAQQQAASDSTATSAVPLEITGKVEQTEAGIVIATNVFDYHVAGKDLSDMVGKTVKATGAVQENAGQYTITIDSITEVASE